LVCGSVGGVLPVVHANDLSKRRWTKSAVPGRCSTRSTAGRCSAPKKRQVGELTCSAVMKILTAILFFLGIPWLFIVVPITLLPIGVFFPEYNYQMHDVIYSIALSFCGLIGIAVWLGYRLRWKLNGFIWLTKRQFWSLSLIHHVSWIFLIPRALTAVDESYWQKFLVFWCTSGPNIFGIWIALSLLISIIALICDHETPKNNHAEAAS
jgi:hypothetical protein